MDRIALRVASEVRTMTRLEVVGLILKGRLTMIQGASILGLGARQLRRLREKYEIFGKEALFDGRRGLSRKRRIPDETMDEICRLKRDVYPDFSMKHFFEKVTEKHHLKVSYTFTRELLQLRGLAQKLTARGKYRRKRERRPLIGMLVHNDASTHEWIVGLPKQDLVVSLDDADGKMLFARFFEQEGTHSTLVSLEHVLRVHGRFGEFYTDRGSHFCRTEKAGGAPDLVQNGQVARVLKTIGIRHILARSPEARGRGERCFGTIQGRLPQELRLHAIKSYVAANLYLEEQFLPDFNRRFTVSPTERGTAFTRMPGIDLDLLVSEHHDRIVANDNTVSFGNVALQLPQMRTRIHLARCPVTVHELLDGTLAVTFSGVLVGHFERKGGLLQRGALSKAKAA